MLHVWHGMLRRQRFFSVLSRMFLIVVLVLVIVTALVLEVNGALVFMRLAVKLIPPQCLIDVSRGKLVQFFVMAKDDDRHINRT